MACNCPSHLSRLCTCVCARVRVCELIVLLGGGFASFLLNHRPVSMHDLTWKICYAHCHLFIHNDLSAPIYRPVYLCDLGVFCIRKYKERIKYVFCIQKYKERIKYMIINISRHVLWFICFLVRNMPTSGFCGMCLNLTTSCIHTVRFFNVLCVVSALNSQAIQRQACYIVFPLQTFRLFSRRAKWNGTEMNIL